MDGLTWRKSGIAFIFLVLLAFGTFTGCGGGGTTSVTGGGDTTGGGDVVSALKATLSGTLLSSSSSSGSSLFKNKAAKSAAATSSLPVSGATVLCFDVDSVSTAASGTTNTASDGTWSLDVDAGNYACFGIYIDLTSLTIKTARMDDIAAAAGEAVAVPEATVESDTTSPSIVSILSDNVADTSLSDGDPDSLYEASDVLPGQAISVIFSEAMNTSTMASGASGGAVLKDSAGNVVSTTMAFNGQGTEFRYTPSTNLTPAATYTLYITNKAKDLSNNGINDPDSDGVVALARITVSESVDPFAYLSSTPKNGEAGVSVYKDLTFTFNRPVDFVKFKDNVTITPAIAGRFEPSGDGVTLFHSTPLTANTAYTVSMGTGVADLGGNALAAAQSILFTTGAGVSSSTVAGFDSGGGTAGDLLSIVSGINKAMLALDNQDLATFSSFFATTFTITEKDCFFDPSIGTEQCRTETQNLSNFLDEMKKDLIEKRNMTKGFGQVERMILTSASGSKMSVEHFNSDFDSSRNPIGTDLYVGWPNRREGVDFVNSEIDVPDPWSPGGTRTEWVTYRLSGSCRDLTGPSDQPGAGEVLATYHFWNQTTQRDEMKTQICPVYDGDADATNSWAANDESYPVSWTGPRNVWEDNDGDCASPGAFNCQNEDGIIVLKDTNADGTPDQAFRYYETEDPVTHNRSASQQDIRAALQAAGGLTVAAAMQVAAANNWDIEGVDNDGDSQINTWTNPDSTTGGFIDRRVNEDWPNGMDDDKDGRIDEDNDGLGANPMPQDMDDDPATPEVENDPTNDPMPHSDWNLANKESVISNDEFWAQTFLVSDSSLTSSTAAQWTDADGNVYYEISGPRGWPYPYAAGADGAPWSGDEFDQYNGSGSSIDSHIFAWADVTLLGRVYFRSDDRSTATGISYYGVYVDLTAAGIVNSAGDILDGSGNVAADPTDPTTRNRVSSTETAAAIYQWDGSGSLANGNSQTIDWQYVRPLMDSIDYNADGDWNVNTNVTSGLRRVPHDRTTGGMMATADYLALGWETWRVSNDYQLVSNSAIVWDVEADWARMEGDDDGDGLFNEDGLYSAYFNADGSLKNQPCNSVVYYPCMTLDSTTGILTFHKKDGTTTTSFDISDGLDNDFDEQVDEVEPWDDDGDGNKDEDPVGDPSDLNGNGNTTEPYDDDGDGRKDEDPISYERDRLNDHTQWTRIYQQTTDAVVDMFYLNQNTSMNVADLVIDAAGTKATAIVDLVETETWTPHNPWGEDFNRDGEPDDVNTWTETMVFKLEKFGSKWLMTGIQSVDSFDDYATQVASGDIQQFGGNVARIFMVSPVGTPETGPAANVGIAPTFQWDDSDVPATTPVGSYLIHIEEITEAMATTGGQPTSVMMILIDPSCVPANTAGVRSYTLGDACGADVTADILAEMAGQSDFPFTTALTALEDGKAYGWGVLAFGGATLDFSSGKPEPVADSFEPMMFATGALPAYMAAPPSLSSTTSSPKAKVGGKVYHAIPSNIAPNFYGR